MTTTTLTQVPTGVSATIKVVTKFDYAIDVGTLVHRIIGSGIPDFTVKPAQTRAGTYEFLAENEAAAIALRDLLRTGGPFNLSDSGTAIANSTFMVTGRISLATDPTTQRVVLISVDFTEVNTR